MVVADQGTGSDGQRVVLSGLEGEGDVKFADFGDSSGHGGAVEGDSVGVHYFYRMGIFDSDVPVEQQVDGGTLGDGFGGCRGGSQGDIVLHVVGAGSGGNGEKSEGKKISEEFHFLVV